MFPSNPNVGDQFTAPDGRVWEWDGIRWVLVQTGGGGGTGNEPGAPSPSGKYGYEHTQTGASTDWDILHDLDYRYVLVQVVDSAGNTVIPDVIYTNKNEVELNFANPKTGTAIIRR